MAVSVAPSETKNLKSLMSDLKWKFKSRIRRKKRRSLCFATFLFTRAFPHFCCSNGFFQISFSTFQQKSASKAKQLLISLVLPDFKAFIETRSFLANLKLDYPKYRVRQSRFDQKVSLQTRFLKLSVIKLHVCTILEASNNSEDISSAPS